MPVSPLNLRRPRATMAAMVLWLTVVGATTWWGADVIVRFPHAAVTATGFFGNWMLEVDGLGGAACLALVLIVAWPAVTDRLSTLAAAATSAIVSGLWMTLLAASDSWKGLTNALEVKAGYRTTLPLIGSTSEFVSTFSDRVGQYSTHVKGHPPLFPLLLHWGEMVGLDTARSEAVVLIVAGASTAMALVLIVALLTDGSTARRVSPLLATIPAVVFTAVSPDALFAATLAWTTCCAAYAYARSGWQANAAAATTGVGAGLMMYLSYGAPLFLGAPIALLVMTRLPSRIALGALGAAPIAVVFTMAGFWWPDGVALVREFYVEGRASERPWWFFIVANLVVASICLGPAVIAGLVNLVDRSIWVVCGAALGGILLADLSGMSKAEVERIWLPLYALASVAVVGLGTSRASIRFWMATQIAVALILQAGIQGTW